MSYKEYLKESVIMIVCIHSAAIMGYYTACYLRSVQPAPISIGIFVRTVSMIISPLLWLRLFEHLKK